MIKSTAVTGSMTLLSRITGLIRDILFARLLGASSGVSADAFYVAFAIPNFFRRIFAEGAFSQAFVPVMSEHKAKGDGQASRDFVSHMAGRLGLILFIVTLVGVVAAPLLVMALAPGFIDENDKFNLTAAMLRITFPYLIFISLVSMAAGILNTYGRFGAAAFTPVILNLSLIAAVIWLAPLMDAPVMALAWAVFAAGVLQLLFQLPFLRSIGMLTRPRLARHIEVGKVFRLMGPAIFASSISQINLLVNRLLASFLVTGSVSWLYYADRLMEFPLGVFGIALATVILPSLSRKHANDDGAAFSNLMDWSLRWVIVISVPSAVGLVVLAKPILITLFHYGAFNSYDVEMTALALMAFALGLPGFILAKVLAPGFFARQDTLTPARIAGIAFIINIILSLSLVYSLKHTGLALAISIAAFINAGLLFKALRQKNIYRPGAGWGLFHFRVIIASIIMGLGLFFGLTESGLWIEMPVFTRIWNLSLWILAGILIYASSLWLLGLRPAALLKHG